jgi:hypothetical protein
MVAHGKFLFKLTHSDEVSYNFSYSFSLSKSKRTSHWYECPNGHPYFIGDCGGAMETARCIECGEQVGGGGHQLLGSNRSVSGIVREVLNN